MTRWRVLVVILLGLFVGVPLARPLLELASRGDAWKAWSDAGRLLGLAENTILLLACTLALALPLGIAGAVLLYRSDLPLRGPLRFLTVWALFVPLPLLTSAWQAALGVGGWLPVSLWGGEAGRPWATGFLPAVWVHAQAALPWVVLIIGHGLSGVEGELEEDALLAAGPWRVFWSVTLRRSGAAVAAAALWVVLQTAGEIAVTDVMQVRTYAEEVYTQIGMGDADAIARAVAEALPAIGLTWLALVLLVPWLQGSSSPSHSALVRRPLFRLGRRRWPCLLAVLAGLLLLAGLPIASLVWKAGLQGRPLAWSAGNVGDAVLTALRLDGIPVGLTLLWALLAGGLAAVTAMIACWLALEARWFQALLLGLLAVAWSLPGPVVGIGLKDTIMSLVLASPPRGLVSTLLYNGPSRLPVLWAHLVRFLPCAVAVLWPVLRLLPRELRDAARVDGASPLGELWHLIVPFSWRAMLVAVLVVTALALGEISVSKMVKPPGSDTFTQLVFDRMHYGVGSEVAGLCLLLLCLVLLAGIEAGVRRATFALTRSPHRTRPAAARPALLAERCALPPR